MVVQTDEGYRVTKDRKAKIAYLSSLNIVGFTVEIVAVSALKSVGDVDENIYETMLDVLKNKNAICVIGDENVETARG